MENIENLIIENITTAIKNGFNKENIYAILHQIEINNRKPRANFGLSLLYSQIFNLNHSVSMVEALDLNTMVARVKKDIE